MLLRFVMPAALGVACAGCSAPSNHTTLAADNPANPNAASVPFVRPVNVLAERQAPPPTASPEARGPMAGMGQGSMPGMKMPGDPQ